MSARAAIQIPDTPAAQVFFNTLMAECARQDALRASASQENNRRDELPPRHAHVK